MMDKKNHFIIIFLTATILMSCTNVRFGRPIDVSEVELIESGYSTDEDIIKHFGRPDRQVTFAGGMIWYYREMNGKGYYRNLVISFNSQNKVATFSYK